MEDVNQTKQDNTNTPPSNNNFDNSNKRPFYRTYRGHFIARILLGAILLALVFGLGIKIGEHKGMRGNFEMRPGTRMIQGRYGNNFNGMGRRGMRVGLPEQTATSSPTSTSTQQ